MKRIKGLDTIRFVCAIFVMFGHLGVPFLELLKNETTQRLYNVGTLIGLTFNGGAAVIVFFIISGFCIHYPFQNKQSIYLPSYYARRLLRILLPTIVVVLLHIPLHEALKYPNFGVFWSIICEVIYYLIYPFLFNVGKKIKWEYIILISFSIFIAIFFFYNKNIKEGNHDYNVYGLFTWIIGLPSWLLGCWLAENYSRFPKFDSTKIWVFRICMVFLSLILNIIKFHIHNIFGSNCFTLNIFSFVACVWIGCEIIYLQEKKPSLIMEWCGKWSYSLYIIHPITQIIMIYMGLVRFTATNNPVTTLFALLFSFIFYLCIEKPSHKLSAFAGNKLSKK